MIPQLEEVLELLKTIFDSIKLFVDGLVSIIKGEFE